MQGFTPISPDAFHSLLERIPRRLKPSAAYVAIEILFRARRSPCEINGIALERGDVVISERTMATDLELSYQTIRTIIKCFRKVDFLTRKLTHPIPVLTICNFYAYVIDNQKSNALSNAQVTHKQRTSNAIPKEKVKENIKTPSPVPRSKSPPKPKKSYQPTTEALHALQPWIDEEKLPKKGEREDYLKIFDDLHRIDEYAWELILRVDAYAREHAYPKYFASPMKYRKKTNAGDVTFFERQRLFMEDRHNSSGSRNDAYTPGTWAYAHTSWVKPGDEKEINHDDKR